ncbi:MAG TPA: DbpA RNA binding domain-containing protein [Treponemataceae bacterium]|nr:DbpA RNA binding domain-containing protein [Treponemataceae bacterium]
MAEKQKTVVNEEQVIAYLQDIVLKIRTEEDPLELNVYRRLFRKAVPFTLRAYFAAYLLKQIDEGKSLGKMCSNTRQGRNTRREAQKRREVQSRNEAPSRREQKKVSELRDEGKNTESHRNKVTTRTIDPRNTEPRPVLAEDVSTTLFISIGRNRRVYPRDLIGLIMQNTEIDRDHIGEIRVLDNYSFVQVITEDAEKIIDILNDFEYRGRKLAVSYSRKREDNSSHEPSDDTNSFDDSGDNSSDSFSDSGETYISDNDEQYDDIDGNA